jgi:prophage regulatory protein
VTHQVLIPLPGIGTLSLTRAEYDAALIPIAKPEATESRSMPTSISSRRTAPRPLPVENHQARSPGLHYLRLRDVCARVALKPSAIYNLIKLGRFPKQVKLSERTAAWVESEVEAFMEARLAERDRQGAKRAPLESPYMRLGEIMKRTSLNSSTIYELIRKGTFPKWANLPKIASGWLRTDIEAWLAARPVTND